MVENIVSKSTSKEGDKIDLLAGRVRALIRTYVPKPEEIILGGDDYSKIYKQDRKEMSEDPESYRRKTSTILQAKNLNSDIVNVEISSIYHYPIDTDNKFDSDTYEIDILSEDHFLRVEGYGNSVQILSKKVRTPRSRRLYSVTSSLPFLDKSEGERDATESDIEKYSTLLSGLESGKNVTFSYSSPKTEYTRGVHIGMGFISRST